MRRLLCLLLLAVSIRLYAQWVENKTSEEMSHDETDTLMDRKAVARKAEQSVEDWRKQIRYNHGQSDRCSVDLFESEGYVERTCKEIAQ